MDPKLPGYNRSAAHSPWLVLRDLDHDDMQRDIREGMVPPAGSRRRVGPEYTALLREFVQSSWNPQTARSNAPSLDRAIRCLERLRENFDQDAPC